MIRKIKCVDSIFTRIYAFIYEVEIKAVFGKRIPLLCCPTYIGIQTHIKLSFIFKKEKFYQILILLNELLSHQNHVKYIYSAIAIQVGTNKHTLICESFFTEKIILQGNSISNRYNAVIVNIA